MTVPMIQSPNTPMVEPLAKAAMAKRQSNYQKANRVVCCITEKIERICLKRSRTGRKARADLD
jgi:hypothetical protein